MAVCISCDITVPVNKVVALSTRTLYQWPLCFNDGKYDEGSLAKILLYVCLSQAIGDSCSN